MDAQGVPPRTEAQERRFRFALFETTGLYAFRLSTGPTVIVLPHIELPESFPEPGTVTWEENTVCQGGYYRGSNRGQFGGRGGPL